MNDKINEFIQIRSYVMESVMEKFKVFVTDIWDPFIKFVIIREVHEMINKELEELFPDFPKKMFPQVRIRIDEDSKEIELGVQTYLNQNPGLTFLGVSDVDDGLYDFYIGETMDSREKYNFFARYGHYAHNVFEGSRTAESEYFLGMFTPLSVAYSMAIEDGFIS
jgi:hypothetical protein